MTRSLCTLVFCVLLCGRGAIGAGDKGQARPIDIQWGQRVPLRDGITLNATAYLPRDPSGSPGCLVTLTPYTADTYHERGRFFAEHGYPFFIVDVRGRGDSGGEFHPNIQESQDGYDVVEWLAKQEICHGKVAMWGGSYAGYAQWATARERPPHLATIVPVAAPYPGVDWPMRANIPYPYVLKYLTYTRGRTVQTNAFNDTSGFWADRYRSLLEAGLPFAELDRVVGNPSAQFHEWMDHPERDAYWDRYNATPEQYRQLTLPILSITGYYDVDQAGALEHYRDYMEQASPAGRARHYLVLGPWDHAGTRVPRDDLYGMKLGEKSLVDLSALHLQWYGWTMSAGTRPDLLRDLVAYYVMGADRWRYAHTLRDATGSSDPYFLSSDQNPTRPQSAGRLATGRARDSRADSYEYDPKNLLDAEAESPIDADRVDRRFYYSAKGQQLVYQTAPFESDTEVTGFFRLMAWISIDQPDTDFSAFVYDVDDAGRGILLTSTALRARYRETPRTPKLIQTNAPLPYSFGDFTFVSRQIQRGHRLRLVVGPLNSIFSERNYNSGGIVAQETPAEGRVVHVRLYHDHAHPSALYVPLGRPLAVGEADVPPSALLSAP